MTRHTASAALLAALVLAPQAAPARAEPAKPGATLPADVGAYVTRRMACNHWSGEDAYDAERGRAIAAAVKDLRCASIEADEAALRRRHGRDRTILKALDAAADADG